MMMDLHIFFCRPNTSQVISQAIEVLLLGSSNQNHRVRSLASENLRKLVKVFFFFVVAFGLFYGFQ